MPKGAEKLPVVTGAHCLAGVLDQVEVVLLAKVHQGRYICRVAQHMRDEDRSRPLREGARELGDIQVVGGWHAVDEHRNQAVLHQGRHRGRKGRGGRDHFVARL